jgi:hypothetical protein
MSDNKSIHDDVLNADDLTIDTMEDGNKPLPRLDFDRYLERRSNKKTKCSYCGTVDLFTNGVLSISAKNSISDRTEPPVWFHCECCANMYKHETGISLMPDNMFKDTLKRAYPAMYNKRYSI